MPLWGCPFWAENGRWLLPADAALILIFDPDEQFTFSAEADIARQEAAAAIAVCSRCPVRVPCLALSLRHWDIGRHGVRGLVAADRAGLRRRLAAGTLCSQPAGMWEAGSRPGGSAAGVVVALRRENVRVGVAVNGRRV